MLRAQAYRSAGNAAAFPSLPPDEAYEKLIEACRKRESVRLLAQSAEVLRPRASAVDSVGAVGAVGAAGTVFAMATTSALDVAGAAENDGGYGGQRPAARRT